MQALKINFQLSNCQLLTNEILRDFIDVFSPIYYRHLTIFGVLLL